MIDDAGVNAVSDDALSDVVSLFEQAVGVSGVPCRLETVGNKTFVKFRVGRQAPVYDSAMLQTTRQLQDANPYKGLVTLEYDRKTRFPQSIEADVLFSILARSTRLVAQSRTAQAPLVSYVPFRNNEENKVIQPASHLIVGRRGVGKSTLIARAVELLQRTPNLSVVLDMQAYSETTDEAIFLDVLGDVTRRIGEAVREKASRLGKPVDEHALFAVSQKILDGTIPANRAGTRICQSLATITRDLGGDVYLFLDDFHVVQQSLQPTLLHLLHGALKGGGGWLKVAGLHSLLKVYDPATRRGLQVPGDAQRISLDLTLVDPESAELHLQAILEKFLEFVGVKSVLSVVHEAAFRRLVWANAGVPRDCLQMLGRALEHARRSGRPKVTLTDTNLAIGEFGQTKMNDLEQDARNEQEKLRTVVNYLEKFCLDDNKVNAFLVRSKQSQEREAIQILSDLRIVHLIHQAITPHKAGQHYEAFLLDYSLFTGFRRRRKIQEMRPADHRQFKAKELRKIPALPDGFLSTIGISFR